MIATNANILDNSPNYVNTKKGILGKKTLKESVAILDSIVNCVCWSSVFTPCQEAGLFSFSSMALIGISRALNIIILLYPFDSSILSILCVFSALL